MISITRGLFPAVSDMAREVRYRCFDQPLFEQCAEARSTRRPKTTWPHLANDPKAADRQRECKNWSNARNHW